LALNDKKHTKSLFNNIWSHTDDVHDTAKAYFHQFACLLLTKVNISIRSLKSNAFLFPVVVVSVEMVRIFIEFHPAC